MRNRNNQFFSAKMYSQYISEVERSGILKASLAVAPAEEDGTLKYALAKSRDRAISEFRACHKDLGHLFEKMLEVEESISSDIQRINEENAANDLSSWNEIFEIFNLHLSVIFQYASNTLIGSFRKKLKRIDSFTICLFGRTKAGKSTTMEALTKGDGKASSLFGVGKQFHLWQVEV